ncbi:unnamed protein product [Diatraea saccharalis]|uniref:Uncharacterized protein n=1 Tax=Diatraea saccharalis TaxID=40085 RepID=A0A9N9R2L6_9NEOP|nr:unnamed protein product [Diatraea saccharalis]
MELPVLDKFCFIFDLKTGCITMGILNSILTFTLAIILITFAVDIREATELQVKRDDEVTMSSVVYTIVVLLVVLLFIKFVLDLVFVYAVYKVSLLNIKFHIQGIILLCIRIHGVNELSILTSFYYRSNTEFINSCFTQFCMKQLFMFK